MSTKQNLRDAERYRMAVEGEYKRYFLSILHNSLTVENLPDDVPKRYFLRILFKYGKIGYGNGVYLPVSGVGIDIYGLPTQYYFTGANGVAFTKDARDCQIFRLNDQESPIYPFIELRSKQIADIETSIRQNLFAVRTQAIYECSDQAAMLSLQNAYAARKLGSEVIFQTNSFTNENKLTVHPTEAEYLCDKLQQLKTDYVSDVLCRLGVMTSSEKEERVQTAEVNANVGIAYENINVMADTFNYDAKRQGSPLRMRVNGAIQDFYDAASTSTESVDGDELA
ncbi:MAG: hypothetical protein LUD47_06040 [Clostridia bacterium]|nr:hypothetical protein [Clostridia bacterium]